MRKHHHLGRGIGVRSGRVWRRKKRIEHSLHREVQFVVIWENGYCSSVTRSGYLHPRAMAAAA